MNETLIGLLIIVCGGGLGFMGHRMQLTGGKVARVRGGGVVALGLVCVSLGTVMCLPPATGHVGGFYWVVGLGVYFSGLTAENFNAFVEKWLIWVALGFFFAKIG